VAPEHTWRKSKRSQNGPNCVEIRNTLDQIRDSKNPHGPTLTANIPAVIQTLRTNPPTP
jgi:hypothetical protein